MAKRAKLKVKNQFLGRRDNMVMTIKYVNK